MASLTYEKRPGWLTFAAVVLFAIAFTRVISAINYFGDGAQINDLTNSVFGNHLWAWGIWDLCLELLALVAAISLLVGAGLVIAIVLEIEDLRSAWSSFTQGLTSAVGSRLDSYDCSSS